MTSATSTLGQPLGVFRKVGATFARRDRQIRELLAADLKVAAVVAGKRSGAVLKDGAIAREAGVLGRECAACPRPAEAGRFAVMASRTARQCLSVAALTAVS